MGISTNTIEDRRLADHDRSIEFERFQRRIDEVTDASERIAAPMQNEFEYTFEADSHLWFRGKNIGTLLDETIIRNQEVVKMQPQFMTELIRNHIEREEYDQQRRLALGSEGDADILVVLSPIPDAVVSGTDLGAYDLKRMKTMARIYRRTDTGIIATSLSLDLTDRDGLQAIARRFGQDIPDAASSEDILQMRFWGYRSAIGDEVVSTVRRAYDQELGKKFGGQWHAGRQDSKVLDAMRFVQEQSDLLTEHLVEIDRIHDLYREDEKRTKLKLARHNFAAALTRRLRGDEDAASMFDAGAIATANGEQYSNDCPSAMTASQALAEMAIGNREMTCPFCGLATYGDPCASRIVCSKCAAEVSGGRIVSRGIGRENALAFLKNARVVMEEQGGYENDRQDRSEFAKVLYGDHVEVRYQITIGGADYIAYDKMNGEDIAKL